MARSRLQIPLESITGEYACSVSPRERYQLLDSGIAIVISERHAPERLRLTKLIALRRSPCSLTWKDILINAGLEDVSPGRERYVQGKVEAWAR